MTQTSSFNVVVGNISVRDFGKIEDDENRMVTCVLTVAGRDYECAEYIDADGDIYIGRDSHMSINGIRNVSAGNMEPFATNDMDGIDYALWAAAEELVQASMQAYLDDKPLEVRWHLEWVSADGQGSLTGDEHDTLDDARDAAGDDEVALLDSTMTITPIVGIWHRNPIVIGDRVSIPVRDLIGAEPSIAA